VHIISSEKNNIYDGILATFINIRAYCYKTFYGRNL
jgi:hypothetical protein